jgi:hypothetical protein
MNLSSLSTNQQITANSAFAMPNGLISTSYASSNSTNLLLQSLVSDIPTTNTFLQALEAQQGFTPSAPTSETSVASPTSSNINNTSLTGASSQAAESSAVSSNSPMASDALSSNELLQSLSTVIPSTNTFLQALEAQQGFTPSAPISKTLSVLSPASS